ncbi:MAG: hypothetical protein ACXU8R_04925 [Xanthobacteraceae bacterium]
MHQPGGIEREVRRRHHHAIDRDARRADGSAGQPTDRARRFLARLDGHLTTHADHAARRAFLDRQIEGWQHRYARFVATGGESEPVAIPADPPLAADFLMTITGLMARRCALDEQTRTMSEQRPHKPLPDSILSLLVAADQCCPSIIGHAHVLYHAGTGSDPKQIAKTFIQLKKDADDLFKAIAAVESALNQPRAGTLRATPAGDP